MIRVFIVAPSSVARAGLRSMLADAGFEAIGSTPDLASLDEALLESELDILLVDGLHDAGVGGRGGLALADVAEQAAVVLLADQPDQAQVGQAFRNGVRAVLPREISTPQLQAALQAVAAGLLVVHPAEVSTLLPTPTSSATEIAPLAEPLTKREREVLQMLATGLGNKEIAARLVISDHTAKFHVASILGKLGASTRTEAVAIGIRHGLILL
ncbi:MAG TPA: response regulator transcription factor [Candidatus Acidoferrum sp.]|nr:response regulator transcription factor [Candidatus Acidoferrum sp.]